MKVNYKLLNTNFDCNELCVKQYKDFLKSFYGEAEQVDLQAFLKKFIALFCELSEKPASFFHDLSFLDLFLLLVQLRVYTLGPICKITIKTTPEQDSEDETSNSPEKVNVDLNLERTIQDILYFLELNTPRQITEDNVDIFINFPSFHNTITTNNSAEYYIKQCRVNDIVMTNMTTEQTKAFVENLSAKILYKVLAEQQELFANLMQLNFLQYYEGVSLSLNFDMKPETFLWYCKLFFNETLQTFFDNMFYLSYIGHFNLSYLENDCTPGEYVYFIKKLNASLQEKNKGTSNEDLNIDTSQVGINGI